MLSVINMFSIQCRLIPEVGKAVRHAHMAHKFQKCCIIKLLTKEIMHHCHIIGDKQFTLHIHQTSSNPKHHMCSETIWPK